MDSQLKPAVNVDEILSLWHQSILSQPAQKLFIAVWHRMKNRGATEIWMSDDEASRRSRTLIGFIPAARTELANVGLLDIRRGALQWKYVFIEQSEPDDDDTQEFGAEATQ